LHLEAATVLPQELAFKHKAKYTHTVYNRHNVFTHASDVYAVIIVLVAPYYDADFLYLCCIFHGTNSEKMCIFPQKCDAVCCTFPRVGFPNQKLLKNAKNVAVNFSKREIRNIT